MSTSKKPRADAKLKTLPPERQAAIAEHAATNSLAKTVLWLADDSVATSSAALSQFLSWYAARQQALQREQKILAWLELEKLDHPEMTEEQLFLKGQRKFQILSIAEEDPLSWARIQKTGRQKEMMRLEIDKFQFDVAKLALASVQKLKTISTSKLSDVEKIDAARRALFGELPEDSQ